MKPVGFCVLNLSKLLIYEWFYAKMQSYFREFWSYTTSVPVRFYIHSNLLLDGLQT